MQITIKDTAIAQLIGDRVQWVIFEEWDDRVRKAAGVPKKSDIVKEIMADEKYMQRLAREIQDNLLEDEACGLSEAIDYLDCKILDRYDRACEKVFAQVNKELEIKQEADELKHMIQKIEAAGFKVTGR